MPGLNKEIQHHELLSFYPSVAKQQIEQKVPTVWTVILVIADDHFNLPQEFSLYHEVKVPPNPMQLGQAVIKLHCSFKAECENYVMDWEFYILGYSLQNQITH